MGFLKLPWFIVGCFLRDGFEPDHGPDNTPANRSNFVGVCVLLVWLILASAITAQVVRRDATAQHCAVKRRATYALASPTSTGSRASELHIQWRRAAFGG
jgi:hypothetical protein